MWGTETTELTVREHITTQNELVVVDLTVLEHTIEASLARARRGDAIAVALCGQQQIGERVDVVGERGGVDAIVRRLFRELERIALVLLRRTTGERARAREERVDRLTTSEEKRHRCGY